MDRDANKPDQRGGKDRREVDDPSYDGPERRDDDRRKDRPPSK